MFLRVLLRRYRHSSAAAGNPELKTAIFRKLPTKADISTVANATTKLLHMSLSKEEVANLKSHELTRLMKTPFEAPLESETFHYTVLEIIHDNLVKNTALVSKLLGALPTPEAKASMIHSLMEYYKSDKLRHSVLAYIRNANSNACRKEVLLCLEKILFESNSRPEDAVQMAISYLRALALTGQVNSSSFPIEHRILEMLLKYTDQAQRVELYGCMVQTNTRFVNHRHFEELKNQLLRGSHIDRVVARTGILNAKWHDTEKFEYTDLHKRQMTVFFSVGDLAFFTHQALKSKDIINANLYLDLTVTKFEQSNHPKNLQTILEVMLSHSMTFKGPRECVKFLRYILDSGLEVSPFLLMKILTRLRLDGCTEEALLMVNFLHSEKLPTTLRSKLVHEIMQIITNKFASEPKIIVGYFAALFGGKNDEMLWLLYDLGLLRAIHHPSVDVESPFGTIDRADIHKDLMNSTLTSTVFDLVYATLVKSLPLNDRRNPQFIKKLYLAYERKVVEAQQNAKSGLEFLQESKISENVVSSLIEQLIFENPDEPNLAELVHDQRRYDTAKFISDLFLANVKVSDTGRKVFLLDAMISSSILKHFDLPFAAKLFRHGRSVDLPLSFNQLFPFIMHHYLRGEQKKARVWYDLLVGSGLRAKSVASDRLVEIARELQWPVKGSFYLNQVKKKNRAARREMEALRENSEISEPDSPSLSDELRNLLFEITEKGIEDEKKP